MKKYITDIAESPKTFVIGIVIGVFAIFFVLPLAKIIDRAYDLIHPVVVEWEVKEVSFKESTMVLSGVMQVQRDCLYIPPTLARDQYGQNYLVGSDVATAGRTWASTPGVQSWGPWEVVGGKDKQLSFSRVYVCADSRPIIVTLGTYEYPKN